MFKSHIVARIGRVLLKPYFVPAARRNYNESVPHVDAQMAESEHEIVADSDEKYYSNRLALRGVVVSPTRPFYYKDGFIGGCEFQLQHKQGKHTSTYLVTTKLASLTTALLNYVRPGTILDVFGHLAPRRGRSHFFMIRVSRFNIYEPNNSPDDTNPNNSQEHDTNLNRESEPATSSIPST